MNLNLMSTKCAHQDMRQGSRTLELAAPRNPDPQVAFIVRICYSAPTTSHYGALRNFILTSGPRFKRLSSYNDTSSRRLAW